MQLMNSLNRSTKGLNRLIIINVLFYVTINVIISLLKINGADPENLLRELALNSELNYVIYKPWSLITSMFLHLDFLHILFNMIYLYWFGTILSSRWNSQTVVSSYIFGGLTGAVFYIFIFGMALSSGSHFAIGASGGVMSVLATTVVLMPNHKVSLFLIGDVKLKWIFVFVFFFTSVADMQSNMGGKIAHIGGAVFGALYGFYLNRGKNLTKHFDNFCYNFTSFFKRKKMTKTIYNINVNAGFRGAVDRRDKESVETTIKNILSKKEREKEIDRLLDKIKKVGYENLTEQEKNNLLELSKNYE